MDCTITRDSVAHITISNATSFVSSDGKNLQDAQQSCGNVYAFDVGDSGTASFSISDSQVDAGCIEGNIKKAGGPSVTCDTVNDPAIRLRARQYSRSTGRYDRRVARSNALSMARLDLDRGSRELLAPRGLFSSPDPSKIDTAIWSAAAIPGVDECNDHIRARGNVGSKTSIFYTGWTVGREGYENSKGWARKNKCRVGDIVFWETMFAPRTWQHDVEGAISKPYFLLNKQTGSLSKQFLMSGAKYTEEFLNTQSLKYLSNLSQGFAELTKGEAWLFMPDGSGAWSDTSAWGAYEYPALTRNPDVMKIWRVNVAGDFRDPTGEPMLIWDRSRGDGPSPLEPQGTRERMNPPDSPLTTMSPAPPIGP